MIFYYTHLYFKGSKKALIVVCFQTKAVKVLVMRLFLKIL